MLPTKRDSVGEIGSRVLVSGSLQVGGAHAVLVSLRIPTVRDVSIEALIRVTTR